MNHLPKAVLGKAVRFEDSDYSDWSWLLRLGPWDSASVWNWLRQQHVHGCAIKNVINPQQLEFPCDFLGDIGNSIGICICRQGIP